MLAVGESYTETQTIALPILADGDYLLELETDETSRVYEGPHEDNNIAQAMIRMRHVDLVPAIVSAPAQATSGDTFPFTWTITNNGTATTLSSWTDRVYLSADQVVDSNDLLFAEVTQTDPLAPGQLVTSSVDVTLPLETTGPHYLLLVTDRNNSIQELATGEANNQLSSPLDVALVEHAELSVSDVVAPTFVIADPAQITVAWTVHNLGEAAAQTGNWYEAIVVNQLDVNGNIREEVELTRLEISEALPAGQSIERQHTFFLPPAFLGRYFVSVRTDVEDAIFENGIEDNNIAQAPELLDIMPIPYADMVVDSVDILSPAASGQPLTVQWSISNQGIATTNSDRWSDQVYLSPNADGSSRVLLGSFEHLGFVQAGDSYTRTAAVNLPNGVEGTYYLVVLQPGGPSLRSNPFEFVYLDNNTLVSDPFQIGLSPPPDLVVSEITAPATAEEGTSIDISWTVSNEGSSVAKGPWTDRVFLQRKGTTQRQQLGSFDYVLSLPAGQSYTRSELFQLPKHTSDLYEIVVETDASQKVYEHNFENNNTTVDDQSLTVTVMPRPDLQVSEIVAPDTVDAGSAFSVEYVIINLGPVETTVPQWQDNVYLSLDDKVTPDDLLIGSFDNGAALGSGESYRTITGSIEVPKRFGGTVYVLVSSDHNQRMDEWPHETNNTRVREIFVNPWPFADLVTSGVVAPDQAFEGNQLQVRYTVTNLGSGPTDVGAWQEQIWLTTDRNRPHPSSDILLSTFDYHGGPLERNAGYDRTRSVTLPDTLLSGTYYITPWVDPFSQVLEQTLVDNINPDDPNEIDNNNYKARPIGIIGTPPATKLPADIAVHSILLDTGAVAGEPFTFGWTVENVGQSTASAYWTDRVYLSDQPTYNAPGSHTWLLGQYTRPSPLAPGASYTRTQTTQLSPATAGQYLIVRSDLNDADPVNNEATAVADVTRVVPDLTVTSVSTAPQGVAGQPTPITYEVTNTSNHTIWDQTRYWSEEIFVSKDPTFLYQRATRIGLVVHDSAAPLGPGESYTTTLDVTLPDGIEGDHYLHVLVNVHGTANVVPIGWPLESGNNQGSADYFTRRAFEDPQGNIASASLPIVLELPDLQVTDLVLPASMVAGEPIEVVATITNTGLRATAVASWKDALLLSTDPSLDSLDYLLVSEQHDGVLQPGESYDVVFHGTLPQGIEGDFYLLAFADTSVGIRRSIFSNIGTGLLGVGGSGTGAVDELGGEGNNVRVAAANVTPALAPDLRVIEIGLPERATRGQLVDVTYQVRNLSSMGTPADQSGWDDLFYLSRDEFLDLRADRYLARHQHSGGLGPNESYVNTMSLQLPSDVLGAWYVFVITDPARYSPRGAVFEAGNENNNELAGIPLIIELPPATDLQVTDITVPNTARPGEPLSVQWQVTNTSTEAAAGTWSDSVFLSADATWDINDVPLGKAAFSGTLARASPTNFRSTR